MLGANSASSSFGCRRMGNILRCLLLMISSLAVLTVGAAKPAPAARYNLLVISVDTLRADHLKCYGYDRDTSPHLDQFAKEGVLFENLTAVAPWTVPSHMSMFTSLYPSVHGVQKLGNHLGKNIPTMAQSLAQNGYVTAAFVTGPVLDHAFRFNRGFDSYDDFSAADSSNVFRHVTNPKITNLAVEWLKKHSREPFFLFLHYWDCHCDYKAPPPFDKKFDPDYTGKEDGHDIAWRQADLCQHISVMDLAHLAALYDEAIAYTDEHVGMILQILQDLSLSDKTLVIVLSDHGEAFLEHGMILHGNSVYEEEIHVPLIMRLPGVIPAGKRVAGNVSHVDLMPTALGFLGVKGPPQMQGIDLSPAILSDKPIPERLIYSELATFFHNLRAVRWGDHKLLGTTGTLDGAQLEQVLGNREKVIAGADLKKDCPEAALRAFVEGPPSILKVSAEKAVELDAERMRQLKSLGYVQ